MFPPNGGPRLSVLRNFNFCAHRTFFWDKNMARFIDYPKQIGQERA